MSLLLLFVIGYALDSKNPRHRRFPSIRVREVPLLAIVPLIGAIPLVIYSVSTRPGSISIFLPRYMIPCLLALVIACAHLTHRALRGDLRHSRRRIVRMLVPLQILVVAVFIGHRGFTILQEASSADTPGQPGAPPAYVGENERLVIEHIHVFLQWHFYADPVDASWMVFIVDREVGIQQGGGGPLNHQIMAALRRQFPKHFKDTVDTTEEFLSREDSFWVLRGNRQWTPMRIENNPDFIIDAREGDYLHVQRAR